MGRPYLISSLMTTLLLALFSSDVNATDPVRLYDAAKTFHDEWAPITITKP